jgi:hypothetical protein
VNEPGLWSELLESCVFWQRSALLAKVCDDPSAGLLDCRILGDERTFAFFGLTGRNASTNDVSSLGGGCDHFQQMPEFLALVTLGEVSIPPSRATSTTAELALVTCLVSSDQR